MTEAAQVGGPTDLLLTPLGNGQYAFNIQVAAADSGAAGNVTRNTLVVPTVLPSGYVTSYATGDFTGGMDAETNAQLLVRLQQSFSTQAPSGPINMAATLRQQFPTALTDSVVGSGSGDMIRNRHTIWPTALPGYIDWYVRTTAQVQQVTIPKTATLVQQNGDNSCNWSISLSRTDAPGFYEVAAIQPPVATNTTGSLPLVSVTAGVDLTGSDFVPDIQSPVEAAFSMYQTATVVFKDNVTNQVGLIAGHQATYNITVRALPGIDAIQEYFSQYDQRNSSADLLVKAPVPCFVLVDMRLAKSARVSDPDTVAIQQAVAAAVNSTDFTGRLYAGTLQAAAAALLPAGMLISLAFMVGRIRYPDGSAHYIRSDEVLNIAPVQGAMVSQRTVQFFCSPQDVTVEISNEIPTPT